MKTLLFGIGNDILSDDGIGPKLVEELRNEYPGIFFETAHMGGLDVLELIREYDKVIFIDAIKTAGGIPGSVYLFTPDDFRETLHLSNFHDINFLTSIELAKRVGMKVPESIFIIAIEIVEDLLFSSDFSQQIQDKYPTIRNEVRSRINMLLLES